MKQQPMLYTQHANELLSYMVDVAMMKPEKAIEWLGNHCPGWTAREKPEVTPID